MAMVKLRQVGGSLSLAVPPTIRDALGLAPGSVLEIEASEGAIIARPARPKYTIDELIAACDLDAPEPDSARDWIDAPALGREML